MQTNKEMCDIFPKTVIFCAKEYLLEGDEDGKKSFENLKSSWVWFEHDTNARAIFAKENPQVFVTIGPFEKFPVLLAMPLSDRKRWLSYNSVFEINDKKLTFCAMSYIHEQGIKHLQTEEKKGGEILLSVFTPSFKSKHRIFRPFNSLLKQTYANWEWIIVNDCDDEIDGGENWRLLQSLAEKDNRVRVFQPGKHSGVIGALKRDAAFLGKGDLLVELDHDDDIHPQTFQWLVDAYKQYPNAGMFWTDFAEVMEEDDSNFSYGEFFSFGYGAYCKQRYLGKWRNMVHSSPINFRTIRYIVGVPNHIRVWTAKAYHEMGGHSPFLHVVDDYELILRTFLKYQMVRIPRLCYIQYRNAGGSNFTFIRNAEIQKLTRLCASTYEDDIKKRLKELDMPDLGPNHHTPKNWQTSFNDDLDKRSDVFALVPDDMVSIILTPEFWEIAANIKQTVRFLLDQTYKHFEVIVVGNKHPYLEEAMEEFEEENLRWWNLMEEETMGTLQSNL